jgi:hypothetical protein
MEPDEAGRETFRKSPNCFETTFKDRLSRSRDFQISSLRGGWLRIVGDTAGDSPSSGGGDGTSSRPDRSGADKLNLSAETSSRSNWSSERV